MQMESSQWKNLNYLYGNDIKVLSQSTSNIDFSFFQKLYVRGFFVSFKNRKEKHDVLTLIQTGDVKDSQLK